MILISSSPKTSSPPLPSFTSVSVPDDRLSAADGDDEPPFGSRGIRQRCSHHLPGHSRYLPLPAGEEVKTVYAPTYINTHTDGHSKLYPQ